MCVPPLIIFEPLNHQYIFFNYQQKEEAIRWWKGHELRLYSEDFISALALGFY